MGLAASTGEVGNRDSRSLVQVEGNRLRLTFTFHPRKISFLKKIKGARYDPTSRTWTVPASAIDTLKKSHEFSPLATDYEETGEQREYKKIVAKNPYEVPREILLKAGLDVVFQFDSTQIFILASVYGASSARRFIQSFEGLVYSRAERGFILSADILIDLIRELKAKGFTFGVEEKLGKILKETSEPRLKIISDEESSSLKAFNEAFLCPVLDLNQESFFLSNCHIELLKILFPEIKSLALRKSQSLSLSKIQALSVIEKGFGEGVRIWLTKEAKKTLLKSQRTLAEGFEDGFALISSSSNSFVCLGKRPYLLLKDGLKAAFKKKISDLKLSKVVSESSRVKCKGLSAFELSSTQDSNSLKALVETIISFLDEEPPKGKNFLRWSDELTEQQKMHEKARSFQSLKDYEVGLINSELEKSLFPHQRVAVSWILSMESGFLGDDMGLGKTLSVLAAFEELKARDESDFLLVVCPMSLVRNWILEAKNWTPELRLSILPDAKSQRTKCLRDLERFGTRHLDGLVVNYETLRLDHVFPVLSKIVAERKSFLCVDESHRVKNPQSKSFQALNGIALNAKRRLLLSGTPIPRDIADIWGQMLIIDRGERLGTRYYDWLEKVAELGTKWSEYGIKKYRKEGVANTIQRVHEVLLRRAKEEVTQLPPKVFTQRYVQLDGDQLDRYESVRKELLVRVSSCNGEIFQKEISNILEEYLRAVQIASNPRLVDETWKGDPAKFLELDTIVSDVVDSREEKIIIWSNFRKNIEELFLRYKSYKPVKIYGGVKSSDRAKAVNDFQSNTKDSAKIFIGNPAAAGVGLTLTAAKTAVYVDKTWNAGDYLQSIDRIHRIGQCGTVSIISLQACLIDELIAGNLEKKERIQKALLSGASESHNCIPTREELLEALR